MLPDDNSADDLPESWFKAELQRSGVAEIVVFATVVPVAILWFADSEVTQRILPAFILIPLLLGLRYGFFGGVIAALFVTGVLLAYSYFHPTVLAEFPKAHAVIFLLGGSIAGQFRDYWASHLRRIHASSVYHQTRLAQFSSSFHLLQLSHLQLERQLAGTTMSLRTALQHLKLQLQTMEVDAQLPLGGIGAWLLDFLAEVGNLHVAAIYAMNEHGMLASDPAYMVGEAEQLSPTHPLLLEALNTGAVTSVHANHVGIGQVIAIVPLVDSHRRIHGVVCINAMPFTSIHQRTFDLLGIIARQIGDILASRNQVKHDSRSGQGLRRSLQHALFKARQDGLSVAVIAYKVLHQENPEQIVRLCLSVNRGMDQSWLWHDRGAHPVIIEILPMADETAAQSQLQRLQKRIAEQHGSVIAAEGIQSYVWKVEADQSGDDVVEMICLACDIQEPALSQELPQALGVTS